MSNVDIAKIMLSIGCLLSAAGTFLAYDFDVDVSISVITGAHLCTVLGLMLIKLGYILHLESEDTIDVSHCRV
ncbi:MAG: hypothetical protein HRU20_07305 [Pseudomonadales bacterium]|nr:hypothetical protein [Pseudomonadales bacterium]